MKSEIPGPGWPVGRCESGPQPWLSSQGGSPLTSGLGDVRCRDGWVAESPPWEGSGRNGEMGVPEWSLLARSPGQVLAMGERNGDSAVSGRARSVTD